ncbi:MAG: heme-binding domain-containing protein [Fulvivirga sp.]|nr:heme-binding domain-containing protein [Fulvivirga sp.]
MVRKIFFGIIVLLILIQFFPIDKENPPFEPEHDFLVMTNPPEEVEVIFQNVCYDCHSHKTEYPWYTSVAPVSWWIDHHIEEGREHLNFSEWGNFSKERQKHKLEEVIEEVEEGEMPLKSYTWMHEGARLTAEERNNLTSWVEKLKERL